MERGPDTELVRVQKELIEVKAELEKSQRRAHFLERAFFPRNVFLKRKEYQLRFCYVPAFEDIEIGGDFYDAFETQVGYGVIDIGDVCGKGEESVFMAADARSTLRACLYLTSCMEKGLAMANELIHAKLGDLQSDKFVTAMALMIDEDTGSFTYGGAGHPPAIIRRVDGGGTEILQHEGNLPLGIFSDVEFQAIENKLFPGDCLLMYTDGLMDFTREGVAFEVDGIRQAVEDSDNCSADVLGDRVLSRAVEWSDRQHRDDVAVVVVYRVLE